MKRSLKNELSAMITGNKAKQDTLVVLATDMPGFYKFMDKIINEAEFEILKQGYEKTIIMVRVTKNKENEKDS